MEPPNPILWPQPFDKSFVLILRNIFILALVCYCDSESFGENCDDGDDSLGHGDGDDCHSTKSNFGNLSLLSG